MIKTTGAFVSGLVVGGIAAVTAVALALDEKLLKDLTDGLDGLDAKVKKAKSKTDSKYVTKGDMVQWESDGMLMFDKPRKVVKIEKSEFGKYVFVENTKTGFPIDEVFKA